MAKDRAARMLEDLSNATAKDLRIVREYLAHLKGELQTLQTSVQAKAREIEAVKVLAQLIEARTGQPQQAQQNPQQPIAHTNSRRR